MVALNVDRSALRQESIVEIDDRQVTVVSEVLVEPELLVVPRVLENGHCIKKNHVVLPASLARDYETQGQSVLAASLQLQHLRFVRLLLSRDDPRAEASAGEVGVLATLVLGAGGEIVERGGEEHIPGGWLRGAWVVAGFAGTLERAFELGAFERASMRGLDIEAEISGDAGGAARVRFFDRSLASAAHAGQPSGTSARGARAAGGGVS